MTDTTPTPTTVIEQVLDDERAERTLREQLLRALAGWPIHRESALDILRRWDATERFVAEMTKP